MKNKAVYFAGAIVIILLLVVGVVLFTNKAKSPIGTTVPSGSTSTTGQTPILITDPPQVPAGTQSLIIDYSNEQVQVNNAGSSSWISASGSGSVDLISVVNLSQTIGRVSLPTGAIIDAVRFNVTAATIEINGTVYNVTLPSSTFTAQIVGSSTLNSSSGVVVDLSPAIATIVTDNSTIYVLVPSLKALLIGDTSNSTTQVIGARVRLPARAFYRLLHASPNITITSASVVANDNLTSISITVKDNSNSSVTIRHAEVFGSVSVLFNNSAVQAYSNMLVQKFNSRVQNSTYCTAYAKGSASGSLNSTLGIYNNYGGYAVKINNSICTQPVLNMFSQELNSKINQFVSRTQLELSHSRVLLFSVNSAGSLSLPANEDGLFNTTGIMIRPGQSATLHFSGVLGTSNGKIIADLVAGNIYSMSVQGTNSTTSTSASIGNIAATGTSASASSTTTAPSTTTQSTSTVSPTTVVNITTTTGYTVNIAYNASVGGDYLTNATGWTMYLYTPDTPNSGASTCYTSCAAFWPPVTYTANSLRLPTALSASSFGTITRTGGTEQLTYDGYPLYYYVGDKSAGSVKGQGVGGIWYVLNVPKIIIPTGIQAPIANVTTNANVTAMSTATTTVGGGYGGYG
jgi:predicted lipoprotein with Yx(FWY)xxD motif